MADQVITKQELIDAQKDAQALEEIINGEPGKLVKTRLDREVYTLASVPQINTMTREEVTAVVTLKANKVDVDTALSNLSTTANKYYSTLAAATTDIANIALNQSVTIGEAANSGLWEKTTAEATSLTKSAYDPLAQSKTYTSEVVNSFKSNEFEPLLLDKTKPRFKPLSKNIFDPRNIVSGVAINASGDQVVSTAAISTGLITVENNANLTVSGLQPSTVGSRAIRFLDANGVLLLVTSIGTNLTSKNFSIPFGAKYAQMTLKLAADTFVLDTSAIQFEFSDTPTAFTPFVRGELLEIYGTELGQSKLELLTKPKFAAGSKNLFDPLNTIFGKNLNNTGALVDRAKTVTTGLIDVSAGTSLSVSGLTSSTYTKYGRFLNENSIVLSVVAIDKTLTQTTVAIPLTAKYFQLTIKDSADTFVLATSTIQFELGATPTALTAYVRGKLLELYGTKVIDETQVLLNSQFKTKLDENIKPKFGAGSKNIFKPTNLIYDKGVNTDGSLYDSVGAISTGLIDVSSGGTNLSVSGFPTAAEGSGYKAICFYNSDFVFISNTSMNPILTSRTVAIPAGAKYVQMTLKLANGPAINPSLVQFEFSDAPTAFTPYIDGKVTEIYGTPLAGDGVKSRAHGASYLFFGDSITETSPVDTDVFDSTKYRVNWPVYARDMLKMGVFRNYAKSGASFRNRSLEHYQFLGNQVAKAIANNEKPDVIVIACGTNDGLTSLGTYDTAMAKTTLAELDQTICLEAARHAFWTLRQTWPEAVCFFANPLQRASSTVESLEPLMDGLGKMAKRYGFILIDQNKESGIIRELEVLSGAGKYLSDGLHPNALGSKRQANLIVSKIINHMSY